MEIVCFSSKILYFVLETEMMTMLLEWFLRHQCISLPEMIDWYQKETFVDHMIGRVVHKNWTEPFLNQYGYRTEPLGRLF